MIESRTANRKGQNEAYGGTQAGECCVAGVQVELTAKEFDLLRVLSLNAGRVSTFDALIRQV